MKVLLCCTRCCKFALKIMQKENINVKDNHNDTNND